ncbi:hypothetical protein Pla52n_19310 [Stieleria varia]|uniref:Uncharacterized protein n=2 Tax=Stieleria varia TaxID=2528005 RepID=A0A5C6B3Z5_9BACT|nr:hypothetical protein Pla52n_19310 [Stieleria varia]
MAAVVAITLGGFVAEAHEGPPFPLLMDEPLAGHKVSIWADPDIGEARFFVILELPSGAMDQPIPDVSLWTEPVNGRLERVTYKTERQPMRGHLQFLAQPTFDLRDMWRIGVEVSVNDGPAETITTEVESTPPGFGVWDLLVYLFPFVLLGGMWIFALLRRQKAWQESSGSSSSESPTRATPSRRATTAVFPEMEQAE